MHGEVESTIASDSDRHHRPSSDRNDREKLCRGRLAQPAERKALNLGLLILGSL